MSLLLFSVEAYYGWACPKCYKPFRPFIRGQVFSMLRAIFGMRSDSIICEHCKEIVGHE